LIPSGTYTPRITDTSDAGIDSDAFEAYFNDYVRDESKTVWSYVGVSVDQYHAPENEGYTSFAIYRVEHTDGRLVE